MSSHSRPASRSHVDDLVRLKRLSDPQTSPDGRYVAYRAQRDGHGREQASHRPLAARPEREGRHTAPPHAEPRERHAARAGRRTARAIYFLSTRSGSSQVWRLQLAGGEATQVTDSRATSAHSKWRPLAIASPSAWKCSSTAQPSSARKDRVDSEGKAQGDGPRLRPRVHPPLGHVERRHALAPVRRDRWHRRQGRRAARRIEGARCATCRRSRSAATRNTRFTPDGSALVFAARVAGRDEAVVHELRPLPGARRRLGRTEESHR